MFRSHTGRINLDAHKLKADSRDAIALDRAMAATCIR